MRIVAAIGVFCGIGLLQSPLAAVGSEVFHIAMEGAAPYYTPKLATVTVGYPIQFDNGTATDHTATHESCLTENSCAFDSGVVSPGNSFVLPSLQPGTYPYYCRLHPIMRGVVTVIEATVLIPTHSSALQAHPRKTVSQMMREAEELLEQFQFQATLNHLGDALQLFRSRRAIVRCFCIGKFPRKFPAM